MLKPHAAFQDEASQFLVDCARACVECEIQCEATSRHSARQAGNGRSDYVDVLRACNDCAEVCRMTASLAARRSPLAEAACRFCAEVCDRCGDACEAIAVDAHVAACLDECRECARVCREIVELLGDPGHDRRCA